MNWKYFFSPSTPREGPLPWTKKGFPPKLRMNVTIDEGESLNLYFHEGWGLQTRKSLSGPLATWGHGFAHIVPSMEILVFMSEYFGLFSVNINFERWVSFSDRYRSRPDSLMGKSYGDFGEMDENLFFHEGALFRTFFIIFALTRPVFSNKGFSQKQRIV